jgi:hypothetical protein
MTSEDFLYLSEMIDGKIRSQGPIGCFEPDFIHLTISTRMARMVLEAAERSIDMESYTEQIARLNRVIVRVAGQRDAAQAAAREFARYIADNSGSHDWIDKARAFLKEHDDT